MVQEKVLLFNFKEESQLKAVRTTLFLTQIPERIVQREEYGKPLKELLKEGGKPDGKAGLMCRELDGQMLVFAGLGGERLESLLSLLRSNPACGRIPYKAVLTEMNQDWNAYVLLEELKREHKAMCEGRQG